MVVWGCAGDDESRSAGAKDAGSAEGSSGAAGSGAAGGAGGTAAASGSGGTSASGGSSAAGGSAGAAASAGAGGSAASAGAGASAGSAGAAASAGAGGSGGGTGGSSGAAGAPTGFDETNYTFGMNTIAYEGGTFFHTYYSSLAGAFDPYLRTSTDGVSWTTGVRVNATAAAAQTRNGLVVWPTPTMTHIAVVYVDESGLTPRVYAGVSTNAGASFTENVAVDTAAENNVLRASIARGEDGTLWVTYVRRNNGSHDGIYFTASANDGTTWSAPALVGQSGSFGWNHHVVAGAAGEAWVVVNDTRVAFTNSIVVWRTVNGGTSWNEATVFSGSFPTEHFGRPVMRRSSNGDLHVGAWQRHATNTDWDFFYSQSTDGGMSWTSPVRINDDVATGTSEQPINSYPALAFGGGGRIYAVWSDDRNGPNADRSLANYDVFVAYSTTNGASWSTDVQINDDTPTIMQRNASVAIVPGSSRDTVVTVWTDGRSGENRVHSDARMLP